MGFQKLKSQNVGIDQGSRILFSDHEDGGVMWTGDGPRELVTPIRFSEGFASPPTVHLSMSMWDMDQKTNLRVDVTTANISSGGFDIVFKTWGDTRIARVRVDWLVIGELPNDDDWDVR